MKTFIALAIVASSFLWLAYGNNQGAARKPLESSGAIPVLKVDDAHYFSKEDNLQPERYQIPPASAVILDARGYAFNGHRETNRQPLEAIRLDRVSVDMDHQTWGNRCYELSWTPGQWQYELSSSNLMPRAGSPRFEGFKFGERWFIFVGTQYRTNKFAALWTGAIEVR